MEENKYKNWGSITISPKVKQEDIDSGNWKPQSVINHTQEFVDFINSLEENGFNNKIEYYPFEVYKAQAFRWLEENVDPYQTDYPEQTMLEEVRRVDVNTLYFAEKYAFFKEGSSEKGLVKYRSKEHNALIYYLIDCGYCLLVGKPRQIFATTTIGIFVIKRLLTRYNYYMKFVTVSDDKGTEILTDKFKFPFQHLPDWMKCVVNSDNINAFHLGEKKGKGDYGYPNSRCEKVAPSPTAINGGAPQMTLIDEIGEVPDLINILFETRPTLFIDKNQDGNLQLVRQILSWGCVCAGTKVWDNNGNFVNIEDLQRKDGILGYDSVNGIASKEDITYWQEAKEKPCYRITTNTLRKIECSEDHPILWSRSDYGSIIDLPKVNGKRVRTFKKSTVFKRADEIKIGDQLAIIEEVPIFGNETMWQPRLVGWLIGDGSYGFGSTGKCKTPVMSTCDHEIYEYIENNFDVTLEQNRPTKNGKTYKEIRIREITKQLRELGIYGQKKLEKRLPINHHSYCENDICELLGGLFDTDGCVHYTGAKSVKSIDLTSSCYEMLDEVRMLLQKLGIHCNISRIKCNPLTNPRDKNDWFVLCISDVKSVRQFHKKIRFAIKYKQERLESVIEQIKDSNSRCSDTIKGVRFERVINVEYIGIKPVYNLTANTTNTYIANGIVTHNTGVSSNTGKRAFQQFWTSTKKLWDEGEYKAAIFVPVFLSWHCRATPEVYESEKKAYLTGVNESVKNMSNDTDKTAMFNMHYPSKPHDMFGMSSNTLVSKSVIEDGFKQIKKLPEDQMPVWGYFEPIYDTSKPIEGYTPFKITGAVFVPTSQQDYRACVCMMKRPDQMWRNRYFQGTDPVLHDTGRSFMCSVVWDWNIPVKDKEGNESSTKAPICFVYHRTPYDTKESYLQCMLMGLYYDTDHEVGAKEGVPDLIENNIGVAYKDFKEFYGFYKNIVYNTQLFDPDLQGGGAKWGINTSGHGMNRRKSKVVSRLKELIYDYGQNIYYKTFWEELQTYVSEVKTDVVWKPVDPKIYRDDCLDGTTFGYICGKSHEHKRAYRVDSQVKLKNTKYEIRRDSNYNNILVPVVKTVENGKQYDNNL